MPDTAFPNADYITIPGALSSGSKTEIFTPADIGAEGAHVLSLRVVDSTGSVNTALTVHCQASSNDTERVLDRTHTAIPPDFAYVLSGDPVVVLGPGGTIDLTGASGHHWWLTVQPRVTAPIALAQTD